MSSANASVGKSQGALNKLLIGAPSYLAALALFALMLMTFFDVILRSIANNPIEAATELTRLFMAIIVFSSLPVVTWQGKHIVVDLLDAYVPVGLARWRDAGTDLFCGVVLCWPALRVWELAARARSYGDTTEYLQIPQFYVAYFIGVSTLITAIVLMLRALVRLARPQWLSGLNA